MGKPGKVVRRVAIADAPMILAPRAFLRVAE
jgi:hypothetical protein